MKKTITPNLLKVATLCLLLFAATFASSTHAQSSACCDSTSIYTHPDPLNPDSCAGTVYLKFKVDTNCKISRVIATNTYGLPVWDTIENAYKTHYSTARGNSITINAYFIDSLGDTLCTKSKYISCQPCCDSIEVFFIKNNHISDSCRGFVYFKFGVNNPCGISIVTATGTASQPVWDASLNMFKAPCAIAKGDNINVTGYFYDSSYTLMCQKNISIGCEEDPCCEGIILKDDVSAPNPDCCGKLTVIIEDSPCEISTIAIDNHQYNVSNFSFNYCVQVGHTASWIVYFMSPSGDTLCEKIFFKDCINGGGRVISSTGETDNLKYTTNMRKSLNAGRVSLYPNPANNKLVVSYEIIKEGAVQLQVFNTNGDMLDNRSIQHDNAGNFDTSFDIAHLANGIYLMRIVQNNEIKNIRFTVIK